MALRALPFLLLAATLCGQSPLVLPGSHAAREGSSFTNVPFGRSSAVRVQSVYDAALFAGPRLVQGLAFRADDGGALAGKQVDCEIRLSTLAGGVLALQPDFAANRGADETVVLPRQLLTLPAQPAAAAPSPFLPPIPLPVPFAYDPAQGSLLVEIAVFGQPPGAYALDATFACDSPAVPFGPAACAPAVGQPLRVESATTQVIWGRPWVARVLDAPANALVVLALGSQETGPWQGFVLPQDLAGLGAPGCYLSLDLAAAFFQVAAGDGSASFPFVIPNSPAALGVWLRYQGGAFAPTANPLGVLTSQAQKVEVCGWEPVGRVWATGLTAAIGTREIGLAAVLQLH